MGSSLNPRQVYQTIEVASRKFPQTNGNNNEIEKSCTCLHLYGAVLTLEGLPVSAEDG